MSKSKLKVASLLTTGLILSVYSGLSAAHHSAAGFDFTKIVTLQGTVQSFRVMNPHTHAIITITDAKGTRDVEYEGHSASNFYRAGFTKDALKSGDKITISIAPRRDGTDGGFIMSFIVPSGLVVGFGGLAPSTGKAETNTGAKAAP